VIIKTLKYLQNFLKKKIYAKYKPPKPDILTKHSGITGIIGWEWLNLKSTFMTSQEN